MSNITYISNYSNASLTCIQTDNVTQICQGTIAVIPFNQDILIVEQTIIMICLIILTLYFLSRTLLRW